MSMIILSIQTNLHLVYALLLLIGGSLGVAVADVTIEAYVTDNSKSCPFAGDMQSLCGFSSSVGKLIGFPISGFLVHIIGSKGVFGHLSIPAGLVILAGMIIQEPFIRNLSYKRVNKKFVDAGRVMWTALKCPVLWRPCLYIYLSLAVSLRECSIGSGGIHISCCCCWLSSRRSPLPKCLQNSPFALHTFLDYAVVVTDSAVTHMIGRLKWMPLLVLSSKLCSSGTEGTFFTLLMAINHVGSFTASWSGGLLLHL